MLFIKKNPSETNNHSRSDFKFLWKILLYSRKRRSSRSLVTVGRISRHVSRRANVVRVALDVFSVNSIIHAPSIPPRSRCIIPSPISMYLRVNATSKDALMEKLADDETSRRETCTQFSPTEACLLGYVFSSVSQFVINILSYEIESLYVLQTRPVFENVTIVSYGYKLTDGV